MQLALVGNGGGALHNISLCDARFLTPPPLLINIAQSPNTHCPVGARGRRTYVGSPVTWFRDFTFCLG